MERHEADIARLRAAYLDLMRDSLIGRLNEDPPLPACKVDGYKDEFRENGWDWPSKAPSMIGAKRMNNVRSECERVIEAGVPGDFMETGVWRGGACIMMRAVLKAYQDYRPPRDCRQFICRAAAAVGRGCGRRRRHFHTYKDFAVPLEEVKAAFARYGLLDEQVVFLEGLFKDTLADGAGRGARAAAARRRHVREHDGRPRQPLPQAFTRRHADRRRLLSVRSPSQGRRRVSRRASALPTRSFRSTISAATGSRAMARAEEPTPWTARRGPRSGRSHYFFEIEVLDWQSHSVVKCYIQAGPSSRSGFSTYSEQVSAVAFRLNASGAPLRVF